MIVVSDVFSELSKYGLSAIIQGNKIVMTVPKDVIEKKILEEIMIRADPTIKNRITVKAMGDVIVEVQI